MYIESRNRLVDIENKFVVTQRGEKAEGKNQVYGMKSKTCNFFSCFGFFVCLFALACCVACGILVPCPIRD